MRRKTRAVAANLAALKAEVAHRFEKNGEIVLVPVAALKPGDRLLVRPGERMAADGVVISGTSEIDVSLVTGETARQAVAAGVAVHAGSLNFSGALTVQGDGGGLRYAPCRGRAAAGEGGRSEVALSAVADRAARFYAPVVHATAALTAIGWLLAGVRSNDAVVTAIAVLIITCPCALALAIPAVQVVASGAMFPQRRHSEQRRRHRAAGDWPIRSCSTRRAPSPCPSPASTMPQA